MNKCEQIRNLTNKINLGMASIDERIELCKLQISILNPNTECGKRAIAKYTDKLNSLIRTKEQLKIQNVSFRNSGHGLRDNLVESVIMSELLKHNRGCKDVVNYCIYSCFGIEYYIEYVFGCTNGDIVIDYKFKRGIKGE